MTPFWVRFLGFSQARENEGSDPNGLSRESLNLRSMDSGGFVDMSLYRWIDMPICPYIPFVLPAFLRNGALCSRRYAEMSGNPLVEALSYCFVALLRRLACFLSLGSGDAFTH